MKSAVGRTDISPEPGTRKQGTFHDRFPSKIKDPIYARIAIFTTEKESSAIIQLDLLSIRWTQVNEIRSRIEQEYGFPSGNIMVSATHNHDGPAANSLADKPRDDSYVKQMVSKIILLFGELLPQVEEATVAICTAYEWNKFKNRRIVQRDGSVICFKSEDDAYVEGPVDPEIKIINIKSILGRTLGTLVNLSTHPGLVEPDDIFTAGFSGVMEKELAQEVGPVTIFLNGAAGNVQFATLQQPEPEYDRTRLGKHFAGKVKEALRGAVYSRQVEIDVVSKTINIDFRETTAAEISGQVFGAQRVGPPGLYEKVIPPFLEKIKKEKTNRAEIQILRIGDIYLIGIPGELFVETGLEIKRKFHPVTVCIVGYSNGMVGYIPTEEAFLRGGYETTFTNSSRLDKKACHIIKDAVESLMSSLGF